MNVSSYCPEYYLFLDTKITQTLTNIGVLLQGVLIDLHAHNFVHAKISCMHTRYHVCNLSSPDNKILYEFKPRISKIV